MSDALAFDEPALLEEARHRTGLADFGDPAFHEPLRRLLHALDTEAGLHRAGRLGQRERVVGLLVNRLRTEEAIRRHPEILEERLDAPLVIVGLARTGTTMLHRMLASDPRMRALYWYESRSPAPRLDADPAAPAPRIVEAEHEVEAMLGASPELIAAHPMDAHAPDEEIMLVEHAFLSTNPEAFCRIPSFAAWREQQDLQPGYDLLARMLRSLSWQKRRRGEPGERWILKTPFHLGHMDVLLRSFPDARIVWTHRDPLQSLPSFASLIHSLRVLGSDSVDPIDVGREWSGKMARAIGRCMDVRARDEERFLDLDYRDLVADPLGCAARVYRFAGLSLPEAVRAGMQRWAVENARDKRPEHRYTLERFGFDADALAVQFARYRERFVTG